MILAVVGIVLATRPGRRWTKKQLVPVARSAAASLRRAASSPAKLGLLFGGSTLITLLYIAALAASIKAFAPVQPGHHRCRVPGERGGGGGRSHPGGLGAIESALSGG